MWTLNQWKSMETTRGTLVVLTQNQWKTMEITRGTLVVLASNQWESMETTRGTLVVLTSNDMPSLEFTTELVRLVERVRRHATREEQEGDGSQRPAPQRDVAHIRRESITM